jgi:hypothetical protein
MDQSPIALSEHKGDICSSRGCYLLSRNLSTGEIPNASEPNLLSSRAYGRSVQIEGTTLHLGVSLVAVHSAPRYNTRKGGCVQKQFNINSAFRATLNSAQFFEKAPALFIERLTTRAANDVQELTI